MSTLVFEEYGMIKVGATSVSDSDLDFVLKSPKKEPMVELTIEEACEILDYLAYLHLRGGKDSFLRELEKCKRNLYERIEQAKV